MPCEHGDTALAKRLGVQAVFANHDYEPQALAWRRSARRTGARQISLLTFKDQVISKNRVTYPKWSCLQRLYPPQERLAAQTAQPVHAWTVACHVRIGFLTDGVPDALPPLTTVAPSQTRVCRLQGQARQSTSAAGWVAHPVDHITKRDYPPSAGPVYLSVHLRFGALSVRCSN